jgi:predicted Zn-ribbon and HTH transcriptional regulator
VRALPAAGRSKRNNLLELRAMKCEKCGGRLDSLAQAARSPWCSACAFEAGLLKMLLVLRTVIGRAGTVTI